MVGPGDGPPLLGAVGALPAYRYTVLLGLWSRAIAYRRIGARGFAIVAYAAQKKRSFLLLFTRTPLWAGPERLKQPGEKLKGFWR